MMGERTTRMESHYEAIEELINSDKEQINRILYSREIRVLRRRFPKSQDRGKILIFRQTL